MYIEKNTNENIVFYESERKNNCWGFVDENGDYITGRDNAKSQIFRLFKNSMALQYEILVWLEEHRARNVKIRVKNYDEEDFWAVVPVRNFRELAFIQARSKYDNIKGQSEYDPQSGIYVEFENRESD